MISAFDPGALLAHVYRLPEGTRVRLRLVQRRDGQAIRALLARQGAEAEEFDVLRLVRFDPRDRVVICATELVGASETVVGVGAIELGHGQAAQPQLLVVDERLGGALEELLSGALQGRAQATARPHAA